MATIPPPAAPSLVEIFDVETQVEPRIVAALAAAGIYQPEPARGENELPTPRVEVRLHLGECIKRGRLPAGSTNPREAMPEAWRCTFLFHVVTDRLKPEQAPAHGRYRALVRMHVARFVSTLNGRLPYHHVEAMNDSGTTPGLLNEGAHAEDISRLQFTGTITVRPSAWPVST